jgi:predicted Zn-dependent protease
MKNSRLMRSVLGAIASGVMLWGCTTNPATGQRFFNVLSMEQEAALGAQAAPALSQEFGGPVRDEQLQAYVTRMGEEIARHTEGDFPKLEWEFTLLDSPVVNAFALPGGKVFITRGLAEKMTNDAQLAGVLGHEVGHVSAQHTARRVGQQMIFNTGLAVAGVAVGLSDESSALRQYGQYAVPALAIGGNLVLLSYGRDEESQADYLGMRYMSRAGYNPRGQLEVMQILAGESAGGARPPEWMASHPLPETRIRRIEGLLNSEEFREAANRPMGEERFQREFLSRLRQVPASQQRPQNLVQPRAGQLRGGQQVISRPRD